MCLRVSIWSEPAHIPGTSVELRTGGVVYQDMGAPRSEGGQVRRTTEQGLVWCLAIKCSCRRSVLEPGHLSQRLAL